MPILAVMIDATRDYEGTPHPIEATFQLDAAKRWEDALHVFDDIGLSAPTRCSS